MRWETLKTGARVATLKTGSPENDNGSLAPDAHELKQALHELATALGYGPGVVDVNTRYHDYISGSWVTPLGAGHERVCDTVIEHFRSRKWWEVSFSLQPDKNFFMFIALRRQNITAS